MKYFFFGFMFFNMLYFIIGFLSIISVIILISSSNINRLALLILSFIMVGLMYTILDFYFLGLTYIIVYVGAIAILFLFVIMMTDNGKTPTFNNNRGLMKQMLFLFTLFLILLIIFNEPNTNFFINEYYIPSFNTEIITFTDIQSLGLLAYLGYPLIIILIGILLWCVLIGILRISGL